MTSELTLHLTSESDTLGLGEALADTLQRGMKIYLSGDLGTGKTTLVRGLLRRLGYLGAVKSPTYTLVELYNLSRLDLHHFDFYRFNHSDEWDDAGFREIFSTDGTCVVEWPEKARSKLPVPDLAIALEHLREGRMAHLRTHTPAGASALLAIDGRRR